MHQSQPPKRWYISKTMRKEYQGWIDTLHSMSSPLDLAKITECIDTNLKSNDDFMMTSTDCMTYLAREDRWLKSAKRGVYLDLPQDRGHVWCRDNAEGVTWNFKYKPMIDYHIPWI